MKLQKFMYSAFICFAASGWNPLKADDITLTISKQYLNLPVSHQTDRKAMRLSVNGKQERQFVIRLATQDPDYWVFCNVSDFKGKKLTIEYDGPSEGLSKIYQSDQIAGQDSIYP